MNSKRREREVLLKKFTPTHSTTLHCGRSELTDIPTAVVAFEK